MAADGASEPRIYGLALQGQHGEYAFVDAAERLAINEPLQPLQPQRELSERQVALAAEPAVAQAGEVVRSVVFEAVDDPQILAAAHLQRRLDQALAAAGDEVARLNDHALAAPSGEGLPPAGRIGAGGGIVERHGAPAGDDYARLLEGERVDAVFTDPPYNVAIAGNVSSLDVHGEFAMASGEMTSTEFTAFLTEVFFLAAAHSRPGAVHVVAMDWRHMSEMSSAGSAAYERLLNLCVWVKDRSGMGAFYRSRHELFFVFKVKGARHTNNVQLGRFGRDRSNVWQYPAAASFGRGGEEGDLLREQDHPLMDLSDLDDRVVEDGIIQVEAHPRRVAAHPRNDLEGGGQVQDGTRLAPRALANILRGTLPTLIQGDARDQGAYRRLMGASEVRMVITDPPYNVGADVVSGLRADRQGKFLMGAGEFTADEFIAFLIASLGAAVERLVDGGLLYSFMDWRHMHQLVAAGEALGLTMLNMAVWVKSQAGMGSLYRSQHELCAIFKKGDATHVNNVQLGRHGRDRSNCWKYPGANTLGSSARAALADHATPKSVEMISDAILDVTHRGEIVLDPFMGSGTTIIAAEKVGRRAYGVELDARYVDVSLRRWQALTGSSAVLEDTGETYAQVRERAKHESDGGATALAAERPRVRVKAGAVQQGRL